MVQFNLKLFYLESKSKFTPIGMAAQLSPLSGVNLQVS